MQAQTPKQFVEKMALNAEGFAGLFRRLQYLPLLPLLELPQKTVVQELERAFIDCGVAESDFREVSLSALVAFALRHGSEYWTGLAVHWLTEGFPVDAAIAKAGDEMIQAKRGTQKARHDLFRIIRRWER
jgi:hypothetical protein